MNDDAHLIDTVDALRILGCSKTTLYRYEAAGMIHSVQYVTGGKKRWRRVDVDALLTRGAEPAPVTPRDRRRMERRTLRKSA